MTQAADSRRKAEEAQAKAEAADNATVKQSYLEIARYWREMSDESEKQK
jgi:hypothetical protein